MEHGSQLTINPAFLRDIKDDNRDLRRILANTVEAMVAPPATPNRAREMHAALGRLRDQLAMHFALEEAFGYFEQSVAQAPRLDQQARQLRDEHRLLFVELCDLIELLEQKVYHETDEPAFDLVRRRFDRFHARLQRHEANEIDLIVTALDEDLGGGD